ncbi:hypothetical protein K9B35_13790 [Sphingomonas sp. R647]|uniref:hypothetical protein n=1 Tax=Sphingomonas sp. R647 TaxID=2875233 RepID=UPI001CD54818|nr:hypothetical protein [Sphingomonas sp. R647]MCA1199045.1 hypothetical protein [Sphingomonas sp. R647]
MKLRLLLAAPLLLAAACTSAEGLNTFAAGVCEQSSTCTVRDQAPRYGSPQQRAVEDVMHGRQEPM